MTDQAHPFFDMHRHGFVRAATSTPRGRTADVSYNRDGIIEEAKRAHAAHVDLLVYPELCVSSYAIDDLPTPAPIIAHRVLGIPLICWTVRTPVQLARARSWTDQITFEGFLP